MVEKDFVPEEEAESGIYNLFKTLLPFLSFRKSKNPSLIGRVHAQLQADAHRTLLNLHTLKEALSKELSSYHDRELWISFEAVINPLLREYRQIEKQLAHPLEDETKIENVTSWIE